MSNPASAPASASLVYRQLAIPVPVFDYIKDYQRAHQGRHGEHLTIAQTVSAIVRKHQQNEECGLQNERTEQNRASTERRSSAVAEPQWQEEWVRLDSIIRHGPLQVRLKLDQSALKRYADRTRAGSVPPPIKLGRVGQSLYLVDGWHRLEAGALEVRGSLFDGETVRALVAPLTEAGVRWEAARANLGHGVPLKRSEYRGVFRAFVKAKNHHMGKGKFMSYRELATALGTGAQHTTLRNWMMQDFPSTARAMGGQEHGNSEAEQPPGRLHLEHHQEASKALETLLMHLTAVQCSEVRWGLLQGLEAAAAVLKGAGVKEPAPLLF